MNQSAQAETGDLLLEINNPTPSQYDYFGESVADVNGNILVGAYGNESVYLFDGIDGSLLLTINNPGYGADFGYSVADVNGNILVGAHRDYVRAMDAGSVYLFNGTDGSLLLTINNPSPAESDHFGKSVAGTTDGNILVGAYRDSIIDAGAAYLFDGTDGSLLFEPHNPTFEGLDYFGNSVAGTIDGNILVGASGGDTGSGSVYLFDGTDGSLLLTINNPTDNGNDGFGYSVAGTIDGNILIGAEYYGFTATGSAYLFDGTDGSLLFTINNPTPEGYDYFGKSVAGTIYGNILVGASGDDTGADSTGSAYLFDGTDGSLLFTINNPTPEGSDYFGNSVAGTIYGNILVGASGDDTGATDAGSVYLFEGISMFTPSPIIASLIADDPDDLDNVYSVDDTITITFDSDTNEPGGIGVQTKTAVNDLYSFTESLGEAYTGQWNTADTFVITVTNTTGATPPIINGTTVTPTGITPILSSDETSEPSTVTSPVLSGDFGIIELFCGQPESYYNVIDGTESSDYLVGTNSPDLIFGNGGNDMINAIGENNCIYAGDGDDSVLAINDYNTVYGGAGNDFIMLKGTGIAYAEDGDDITYIILPSAGHLIDGGNDSDLCVTNARQPINTANCEIIP